MTDSKQLADRRFITTVAGLHTHRFSGKDPVGGPTLITNESISKTKFKVYQWKLKIKNGSSATGPYSIDVVTYFPSQGSASASYDYVNDGTPSLDRATHSVLGTLDYPNLPSLPSGLPSSSDVDTQARIGFQNKVRSAQRSFQGGAFLGELREAIHMVRSPAEALRKSVTRYSVAAKKAARQAARTKGPKKARAVAKALSGTWLEHSFGWAPLFGDVDSAAKALGDTNHHVPNVVQYSAFDNIASSVVSTYNNPSANGHLYIRSKFRTRFDVSVHYKGCVAWDSPNLARDWQSTWGVSLRDFVPTVWELIPYSFLVDYFTNVGKLVDASSTGDVSLRWGTCATRLLSNRELVGRQILNDTTDPINWHVGSLSASVDQISRFSFYRQVVDKVGTNIFDLQLRCPGVKDWHKWANIAALATERFVKL
jgi:hypothetical protein